MNDLQEALWDTPLQTPGKLLRADPDDLPSLIGSKEIRRERLFGRLRRGTQLALFLDELSDLGLWATTPFESTYPQTLLDQLGHRAPPYLFGAGDPQIAHRLGIGFVGSRSPSSEVLDATEILAQRAIEHGFAVVSGGAKGVDQSAQRSGLDHDGPVISYPADGLKHQIQDKETRQAVREDKLLLLSPYGPDTPWSVGTAMGRNKLIHGGSRAVSVMATGDEQGGTWAGATENLKHGWSPLLVWTGQGSPEANQKLIKKGGWEFSNRFRFSARIKQLRDGRLPKHSPSSEASDQRSLPDLGERAQEASKAKRHQHQSGSEESETKQTRLGDVNP